MLAAHAKMSLELRESPLGKILYIYMRQASEASVFNFSVQVKPKYSTEKGGGGGKKEFNGRTVGRNGIIASKRRVKCKLNCSLK